MLWGSNSSDMTRQSLSTDVILTMESGSGLIFLCCFAEGFITGVDMLDFHNVPFVTGLDGFAVLETSSVYT